VYTGLRIVVRKPLGKQPRRKQNMRRADDISMHLMGICYEGETQIELAQNHVK